jgi:hypothetical protein
MAAELDGVRFGSRAAVELKPAPASTDLKTPAPQYESIEKLASPVPR